MPVSAATRVGVNAATMLLEFVEARRVSAR